MRRLLQTLWPMGLACLLAACGGSTPSGDVRITPPPPSALEACSGPVRLTADMDTQLEQERAWAADRRRLVACSEKQGILARWAEAIAGT